MSEAKLTTHEKALKINLDPRRYGTFAEIGAGQEVARWFFRVGGGAGTIAKSMSAYDMLVSDAIYGPCDRYVSRQRLQSMLDHEHRLNLERLHEKRSHNTTFFAFADTVAARSFKGGNECHGWMGIKFQAHPRDEDSQIIIHVRMLDTENALQQEALGIVGVNLLYGAFFLHHEPEQLIDSLVDNLTTNRIEVDMIEFSGIEFRRVDNRLMSLKLVQVGLSDAALFAANGTVLQPSEVFHRKAVLVERGSFRPVCHVNLDMLESARRRFEIDLGTDGMEVVQLMEITMNNLMATGQIDYQDFLARVDIMAACGMTVLVSNYFQYYRLAAYLSRHTKLKIAITMGIPSVRDLFEEKYYTDLDGGILESLGRLFKNDIKLYIYPLKEPGTGKLIKLDTLEIAPDLRPLYTYLRNKHYLEQLEDFNEEYLSIFSRDILKKIGLGNPAWEAGVPVAVAEVIKKNGLFGYRRETLAE
jgi:hypothetical protein